MNLRKNDGRSGLLAPDLPGIPAMSRNGNEVFRDDHRTRIPSAIVPGCNVLAGNFPQTRFSIL
jgi:hypothetical protein